MMFQCFSMFQNQCNMGKSITYQSKKRSCPKFQIKKTLPLKHGQKNATISQVSMFHMFLYIIAISLKHLQEVFRTRLRVRKIMHIGRQGSTKVRFLQHSVFSPVPGEFIMASCYFCKLQGSRTILMLSGFLKITQE